MKPHTALVLAAATTLPILAASTPITSRTAQPSFVDDVTNWATGFLKDLTDLGKKVFNELSSDVQSTLKAGSCFEQDGCKIVSCALELGTTAATCVAAVGEVGENVAADLGCLGKVAKTSAEMAAHELCDNCWKALQDVAQSATQKRTACGQNQAVKIQGTPLSPAILLAITFASTLLFNFL